jgi:hypothetical protein
MDSLHHHKYHSTGRSAIATGEQLENHSIATNTVTVANQYFLFTGLALNATAGRQRLNLLPNFTGLLDLVLSASSSSDSIIVTSLFFLLLFGVLLNNKGQI